MHFNAGLCLPLSIYRLIFLYYKVFAARYPVPVVLATKEKDVVLCNTSN